MKRRLCGIHAVGEALASDPRRLSVVMYDGNDPGSPVRELVERAQRAGVVTEPTTPSALDALAKGLRHQGVIGVSESEFPYLDLEGLLDGAPDNALLVALDEVTDVYNLGAIVRSAVAMGAHGLVVLRHRSAGVTSVAVRASAGATEHARIARVTNLVRAIEELGERGYRSVGLDAEASADLCDLDLTGPVVLVVGAEGKGLRRLVRERCETLGRIPLPGAIASLNASVAAGIGIYEVMRQRRA